MAGSFGFESEHYDVSLRVGEHELLPSVRQAPKDALIIANGFSCREQIAQTTDRRALHIAEVMRLAIDPPKTADIESGSLGEYPELAAKGMKNTGTENHGGPVVTAGGLVFIAATSFDRKFRAFDKMTGKLLWEYTLPMAGNATPVTYEINGRQYVVIYATGGKGKPSDPTGGIYVAFALPAKQ
jgi:hypothetical protein